MCSIKQSQKSRSNRISGKDDFISLDLGKMNLILRSKMTNSDRIVDRSELEMNLYKQWEKSEHFSFSVHNFCINLGFCVQLHTSMIICSVLSAYALSRTQTWLIWPAGGEKGIGGGGGSGQIHLRYISLSISRFAQKWIKKVLDWHHLHMYGPRSLFT